MGKGKKRVLGLLAGVGLLASSALAWGPFGPGPHGPMGPWWAYRGQNPPAQQQGYYGPPCPCPCPCWNNPYGPPKYPPHQQPNPQNPQNKK